jgi:deubiquitinase DESI2
MLLFADDGLGSNASIIDGSYEDDLDHLLTTPNSDIIPSRDRALTPAGDNF